MHVIQTIQHLTMKNVYYYIDMILSLVVYYNFYYLFEVFTFLVVASVDILPNIIFIPD